jgi:hypothetical protein
MRKTEDKPTENDLIQIRIKQFTPPEKDEK